MTRDERPLAAVPFGIWGVLGALLAAQIAWQTVRHPGTPAAADLPPPPRPGALRIASFGEPQAAARVAMLYIQTVDFSAGQALPYRNLDYPRLIGWLTAILELDPRSSYPLFSAARIYAEVPDPERARIALEFVYQASYFQAVHETGARTTHDIKNLLQSLNVLCSVAARDDGRDAAQLQSLVRRQLPVVAQRLAETLERLQRPQPAEETYVPARTWWEGVARQYQGEGVEFSAAGPADKARLPRSLFDSVADNLIRNALAKRAGQPAIRVRVLLECGEQIALRVCDTGAAVPEELAASLMRAPVNSHAGLGIGLYQAARQAESGGYRLALETNVVGEVCFVLSGAAA